MQTEKELPPKVKKKHFYRYVKFLITTRNKEYSLSGSSANFFLPPEKKENSLSGSNANFFLPPEMKKTAYLVVMQISFYHQK